mgnify:CR=1 FL=1
MGFEFIKKLPTPDEIRNQYPIDAKIKALKEKRDQEIRDVFTGKSDKFLAIIGPCSADNEDAVCDYLLRLRKVQDKIADKVLIIPRVYTNKPRTTGEGYKGMVHQPDPEKKPNMLAGLVAIRKMHIRAIEESGFTCADEMLYPENWRYLSSSISCFFAQHESGCQYNCTHGLLPHCSPADLPDTQPSVSFLLS